MANPFKQVDAGTYLAATSKIAALMSPDELRAINNNQSGELAEAMVEALRDKLAKDHLIFTSLTDILTTVRRWNKEFHLGYSEAELAAAEATMPLPPVGEDVAVVLVTYLETVQATFDFLWDRAASGQKANSRRLDMKTDAKHLRLIAGAKHPGRCLRWEVIDLKANRGKSPKSVRNADSPHAAVMAALALHPKWVQAMDGRKVPYVWMAGYECCDPDVRPWSYVPFAAFDASRFSVGLSADGCGSEVSYFAVPVRI